MKKFICATCLLLISIMAMASVQIKALGPPELLTGYEYLNVAKLSIGDMAVISFDQQLNIVEWQAPVMLNQEASAKSARVIDAYLVPTAMGEVSMMLVNYRWPSAKSETLPQKHNKPAFTYPIRAVDIQNFTTTRTDII